MISLDGQFIGLTNSEPDEKPDRGQLNGSCNRIACQKPDATYFNMLRSRSPSVF